MTLYEIYNSNNNVRESDIPEDWKDSFKNFMFGSTCLLEKNEHVYFINDFRRWYRQNEIIINRELIINKIIESKD